MYKFLGNFVNQPAPPLVLDRLYLVWGRGINLVTAWRTLFMHFIFFLRPRRKHSSPLMKKYMLELERNGIVVIENFLPKECFGKVLEEYENCRSGAVAHARQRSNIQQGLSTWSAIFTPNDNAFEHTNKFIRNHQVIKFLVSYIARRSVDYFPSTMSVMEHALSGQGKAKDGTAALHQDAHYPTAKVVLYLTDVTKVSCPFVYCDGSHKLRLTRLALEIDILEKIYRRRRGDVTNDEYFENTPVLDRTSLLKYHLEPQPVVAPANTLIIANHFGLHAHGDLEAGLKRATLRISFRYLESRRYRFRKIFNTFRTPYEGFDAGYQNPLTL